MMKTLSSTETSVLTRTTQRNIPEDAILHSHRREDLNLTKSLEFSCTFRREFLANLLASVALAFL
jgi:hypothetical protein